MIEVTQKNRYGTVEIVGQYTDKEFGEEYCPSYIKEHFATNPIMIGSQMVYPAWDVYVGIRIPMFQFVAYNHKGKILDPTHLIGVSRKYNKTYLSWKKWYARAWTCGFKHRSGGWRKQKTYQESKWNHAWDDEEFCPPVRAKRDGLLPDPWDDEFYIHTEKNWKKFRKHQWKY